MRIILNVPDDVLVSLSSVDNAKLNRLILESLAIEGYRSELLTQRQVMGLLTFTVREELWQFFQEHNLSIAQSIEDI